MNKPTYVFALAALGLLSHQSFGVTSFAGYDWFDGSEGSTLVGDDLVATVGTSSSTWTVYFASESNPVTLANPGDKLVLTWSFMVTGVNISNASQNLRIGLMDSPAETRVTTDDAPGSGAYTGYALFANMGQITDHSSAFQIRERNGDGGTLGTSSLWESGDTGMGKGVLGYAEGSEYTLTVSVERTENGSAQVDFMMTGGQVNDTGSVSVSLLDGTPQPFTFDTFMIRPSNALTTADTFTFTGFTVTAPEGQGGPDKGPGFFGNYDVVTDSSDSQWVDTGAWLGWTNIDYYPWVWVLDLESWMYVADAEMNGDKDSAGAWFYVSE